MKIYEYEILFGAGPNNNLTNLVKRLNNLGERGWHVVSILGSYPLLERERPPEPRQWTPPEVPDGIEE